MLNIKKISIMLLIVVIAVACKKDDEKKELSYIDGWVHCPKGVGDAEWVNGHCVDENDTLLVYIASTYALLSNPKFFDKKLVQTCGYLSCRLTRGDCSRDWLLYPHREDVLHNLIPNALRIEEMKKEEEGGIFTHLGVEGFRHMELPYGAYVCLVGKFSSNLYGPLMRIGFLYVNIYRNETYEKIGHLNEKLDSLLKEGDDISEFQWYSPCSPFEIQKGKIKYVVGTENAIREQNCQSY
jgi:hypothetical protein